MEMKMNVMERIIALGLLPKEGNFASLKSLRVAKETLSLTPEEVEEFKFKIDENGDAHWNQLGREERPINLEEFAIEAVKSKLKEMDEDSKLEEMHVSLYEKFVEKKKGG